MKIYQRRDQRVDEKNEFIFLVIIQKWLFFAISFDGSKKLLTAWRYYLSAIERYKML